MIKLSELDLLVYDCDGVLTDNRVWLSEDGKETVAFNRSDGLAINYLRKKGVKQIILSTEVNPVVRKRAEKLHIECINGVEDKLEMLKKYLTEKNMMISKVLYVGNDINDLEVMQQVGIPIAPSDAHHSIRQIARIITHTKGGEGVIREIYDLME